MQILDEALAGGVKVLPGDVAFKLHDTFGFPLDLSADVCRENGVAVDSAGFAAAMEQQKAKGRAAGKFKMDKALDYAGVGNTFTGYEHLEESSAKIVALYADGVSVAALKAGQNGVVVLDITPFYAESGGQVGDEGEIVSGSARFAVGDTQKIKADVFGHHGLLSEGTLNVGDHVTARVNTTRARGHPAQPLGHPPDAQGLARSAGQPCAAKGLAGQCRAHPLRLRAQCARHRRPDPRDRTPRERGSRLANTPTQARVMDIESAQKTGAMMLFGEKYGETVRVLDIGTSRELCGGTHVQRTGDIGFFTIVAEGGVAAGVRRIEAVTGLNALAYLQGMEVTLGGVAGTLRVTPGEVPARISAMLAQAREAGEGTGWRSRASWPQAQGDELVNRAMDVNGVKLLVARLDGADVKTLRDTMDKLKDKLKTAVIVLGAVDGAKVQIAVGVTPDTTAKVKAGELVNFIAGQVGGKGGGKPDMAMAGGTEPGKLAAALASVQGWVEAKL